MHYVDEGHGDPVVMVHGNPTWSFLFRHLIVALSAGHRCLAPDHIGFGLSDKPAGCSYLPEAHARNLATWIEALGLRDLTLVVHDWGGPIALSYAIAHPDRIKRIVLMNTWLWPLEDGLRFRLFAGLAGGRVGSYLIRRFNLFVNPLMRLATGRRNLPTAAALRHYARPLASPAERRACATLPAQLIGAREWLASLWAGRERIAGKHALILWGMQDRAFGARELRRWEALFPRHRTIRLAGVGHFVPEEMADRLCPAVADFLAGER